MSLTTDTHDIASRCLGINTIHHDGKKQLLPKKIVIRAADALFFGEKKPALRRLNIVISASDKSYILRLRLKVRFSAQLDLRHVPRQCRHWSS